MEEWPTTHRRAENEAFRSPEIKCLCLSSREKGIRLEVIWFDADVTEVMVQCSNGRFEGTAGIYLSHNEHLDIARVVLGGFPSRINDSRTIEVGTFNPAHADRGLRVEQRCADSSGHVLADTQLRGDGCKVLGEVESVALRLRVEPAAIDSFVQQLKTMNVAVGARAFLTGAI